VLTVGELEYRYTLFDGRYPGTIATGLGYSSPGTIPEGSVPQAYGYYVQFEQLVFREANCFDRVPQGLGVFAQWIPTEVDGEFPIVDIPEDAVAGLVYTGLIPGRDTDVAGTGIAWAALNQGGTGREIAVELFYKARLTPSLMIQPDLQYITTPSGIYTDALVAGMRFQLEF
jgi:carbohydrate-selective porin OprB